MRALAKMAFLGVLVSGLLGAGCFDDFVELLPDDGWGSNHTFDNAADITAEQFPTVLAGALITSPEDWFKFDTTDDLTVTVICTPNLLPDDVQITLYDSGAGLLATGAVNGGNVELTYAPGGSGVAVTYYLLVE
ncbi:MAG: hypothetical protein ACYS9X_16445 [Planctomycetota bacterium]|jgi:hypothetical protein